MFIYLSIEKSFPNGPAGPIARSVEVIDLSGLRHEGKVLKREPGRCEPSL